MGNTITTATQQVGLSFSAEATTPPTSVAAVLANAVPSITGLAFFTLPDINATIAQNLDDPIGVLFPFDDFADTFNRGRTVVIIAPTIGNRTVYVAAENRTVVIRPVRRNNVVYITS